MARTGPNTDQTVTVVMPVYNAMPYLDEAIASIAAQTHRDFVLAIYDDHSTDGSYEAALSWAQRDSRISVIRGDRRLGPCGSSNAAAALAKTEIVARMDADDVAAPERLELQTAALQDNSAAVLVGSTFEMIDATGRTIRRATPGRILGPAPPFPHASITYRRADFEAAGGYRPETDYFEDFDLYRRMAARGKLLVVNRPLLRMRFAGQHARLRDDRDEVLRKINFLYIDESAGSSAGIRISAMAFYSLAVLSILELHRPQMLGKMLRKVSWQHPARLLVIIGIVGVAEVSPRLARGIGYLGSRMREHFAARRLGGKPVIEWVPV